MCDSDSFFVDSGAGNAGILVSDGKALVINPVNPGLWERLQEADITEVEMILFTDHRRELADGLAELLNNHPPEILVPEAERELFANPDEYWNNPDSRWRLLCKHVPYHVTHTEAIPITRGLRDGEEICWRGFRLQVLATPGWTDGAVSYLLETPEGKTAFCGDLIFAPGQLRDFYTLQRGEERNGHRVGDYHGFLGNAPRLLDSLENLITAGAEILVPAHGQVIDQPRPAVDLLRSRLTAAYHNYASISALRWYFPDYFRNIPEDNRSLPQQETEPFPDSVRQVSGTSFALIAESGRALLIDAYSPNELENAQKMLASGEVAAWDGIWLTHYHYDHMEIAQFARRELACPILTDEVMADVLEIPRNWFLTCLAPGSTTIDRRTRDGESWHWENFTLTAYRFPGQTLYHSGLHAVPDTGKSLFFAGDAVTPTGIDDYCSWNRNHLGENSGYNYCLKLLRSLAPDCIFNQHVNVAFRFDEDAYELMLANLKEREVLFGQLLPWDHPDFGCDEGWMRCYPYEQEARAGEKIRIEVHLTNHSAEMQWARAQLRLPASWKQDSQALDFPCSPKSDSIAAFEVEVPETAPAGRCVIPVQIEFGQWELGSAREAIVNLLPKA